MGMTCAMIQSSLRERQTEEGRSLISNERIHASRLLTLLRCSKSDSLSVMMSDNLLQGYNERNGGLANRICDVGDKTAAGQPNASSD